MDHQRHLFSLSSLFFAAALVLFVLAGCGVGRGPKFHLGWLGLFCLGVSDALPI
jgi:hypothetical protein